MADHLIVMSVVMEEMDGTPEQSAEILMQRSTGDRNEFPYQILAGYIDGGDVEVTAEDITPDDKHNLDFLFDDGGLL